MANSFFLSCITIIKQYQHWLEIIHLGFLSAFIQRTQEHMHLSPLGNSQVGVRIWSILQSDITPTFLSFARSLALHLQGSLAAVPSHGITSLLPQGNLHPHPITGLGQSLHLSTSHPSAVWHLNSGHQRS